MEDRYRLMLLEARADAQERRESNRRAIHALSMLRKQFWADEASGDLVKAWVREDKRLQTEIHNYNEFLKL